MISVPMFNLAQVNDVDKLTKVSTDVLNSPQHILGPNVHKFEIKFHLYRNLFLKLINKLNFFYDTVMEFWTCFCKLKVI